MLLKIKLVRQTDDLQSAQKEAKERFIKDLLILGEFVLHNCIDEKDNALFKYLLLISKIVIIWLPWTCMIAYTCLSSLEKLSWVNWGAELRVIMFLGWSEFNFFVDNPSHGSYEDAYHN